MREARSFSPNGTVDLIAVRAALAEAKPGDRDVRDVLGAEPFRADDPHHQHEDRAGRQKKIADLVAMLKAGKTIHLQSSAPKREAGASLKFRRR